MKIDQVQMKNELNTLFIHSPGSTAATVQMWFRAGSALEEFSNEGIAHFLEHMFFKGTPTRPGPKLAHDIESYGGEVNAFTSFDYTCYYINTPNPFLNTSVDILLDMVANPLFSLEEIPSERQVVHEEYRRAMDNPSQYNFLQLQKNTFKGGYSHPILGREDTILNFSQEQLKEFRQKYYNLENALLVVAGDLSNREEIEAKINSFKLPHGEKSHFPLFELLEKPSINIHDKDIRQATLTVSFQAPNYDGEETAAQDLAINCLAHGETSRFYQELVAKTSLCNGIAGSTMYFADGGAHMIKMSFPLENLAKIEKLFTATLKDAVVNGLTDDELTKIKNQYISSKVYEKESIESFSFSLGHGFAQSGNIHCEDAFIERIHSATREDVWNGLLTILKKSSHFSLQVPKGQVKPALNKTLATWQKNLTTLSKTKIKIPKSDLLTSQFDPAVKVTPIKPGIKFIYRQNKLTPTFVLHAYLKGGQAAETAKTAGTHHLISRLMSYGYQGCKYEKLKSELEFVSSYLTGFSGKNAYGVTLHGQTKDFPMLTNHFFGTLKKPELPKKFFEHERKIILRAIDNQKEDPLKQAFKKFNSFIYKDHPYSLDLAGTPQTLKTFTTASFLKLHAQNLKKSEIVFTYCGDLDYATVLKMINEMTRDLPARTPVKKEKKKAKPVIGQNEHIYFDREQTQIVIGKPAFALGNVEDLYLKMITAHLSGQSSDLFVEVRDRQGLCYSVSPIHVSALEAGSWGIYIGSGSDKTEAAIKAIMDIINGLADKGISEEEFNRIKTMIDGQTLLGIQTNDDYAQVYSIPVLHGLNLDHAHINNVQIRNAKYADFQKFLKKFMKSKWNIVRAGKS